MNETPHINQGQVNEGSGRYKRTRQTSCRNDVILQIDENNQKSKRTRVDRNSTETTRLMRTLTVVLNRSEVNAILDRNLSSTDANEEQNTNETEPVLGGKFPNMLIFDCTIIFFMIKVSSQIF